MPGLYPAVKFKLEVVDECRSSQEILLLKRGEPGFHGAAVMARKQTAGYGRRGRDWDTGSGNLALSVGLEIPGSVSALALLPFAAGIAVHRTTSYFLADGANLRLKWPNDLYLDGRKLSGLIAQARQYEQGSEVVLGIGLNLSHAPAHLGESAIALSAHLSPPSPEIFAHALLAELEKTLQDAKDFAWVRAEWERAANLREGRMQVVGELGSVEAKELLPTGELLVVGASGEARKLASEDVSLRFSEEPKTAPSL